MGIEEKNKDEEKISTLLEDLTSLESYARDLFTFLPLPVCLISPIGVILEVNPAFEEITGYKISELIGKPTETIFDKEEFEELKKETLTKGLVKTKEINIFTKERKKILARASATLRKSEEEEIIGYFVGFLDLTDIKKSEEEIQKTQEALLNILEDSEEERKKAEEERNKTLSIINNFADGILLFDKENILTLVNPEAEKFFGEKIKNLLGSSLFQLSEITFLNPLTLVLGKEVKNIFRKEISFKKNLVIEVSSLPIIREEEQLGTLVILHNITREKTIERMKTEFVSLAAHQLRTPLSAIKWTLNMLLEGDLGKITKDQRDVLEKSYISNERMISLINDLLDVTRIEEGRYIFKPVFAQIENVVQFVLNSLKEEFKKKKIKLYFKKPEGKLPKVKIDVEKIRLVINNLLENAIKYTQMGGEASVSLNSNKNEVEFTVEDNGAGIPADQQDRIFTKFFRGANVIRMETEGSGLGLFITKNIIEAHGGKIWFESEQGKGTTFHFILPVEKKFEEFLKKF